MTAIYTPSFFDGQRIGSKTSADVIVPIVQKLFSVSSVVDIGCGVGAWLAMFRALGVTDCAGYDGNYVPREMLKIPVDQFNTADLRALHDVGRRYDLACSLEVAEHLPEAGAAEFVRLLVRAAPVVLFSAAIPEQEGADHINLQWQSYWHKLFSAHGYVAVDCIRPAVYGDPRVEWWYRQNTLIYCEPHLCPKGHTSTASAYDLNRIDPSMLKHVAGRPNNGKQAIFAIRRAAFILSRVLAARTRRLFGRADQKRG